MYKSTPSFFSGVALNLYNLPSELKPAHSGSAKHTALGMSTGHRTPSDPTQHGRLRLVIDLGGRSAVILHQLEGLLVIAEQVLVQLLQHGNGVLVVHLIDVVLPISHPTHSHSRIPLQRVLDGLVVVHVVAQRLLVVQTVEHHVEVQLPTTVVVVAHHTVPLARAVVVDLAVGSPDGDLVLRAEQEVARHLLHGVLRVHRRLRLLHRATQQHAQLEVALRLTPRRRAHVGVEKLIQILDDLQQELRHGLRTTPHTRHTRPRLSALVAHVQRVADVQIAALYASGASPAPTRRLALADVALQVAVGVEARAVGHLQALRLQLVDGAATVLARLVLAEHQLDRAVVHVRVLHVREFVAEGDALADVRAEHAQRLREEVLVLLARHVHHVVVEGLGRVLVLLSHLAVIRCRHHHLANNVVRLGHHVEVGDAVLAVEEGLPHHGRVRVDVRLYTSPGDTTRTLRVHRRQEQVPHLHQTLVGRAVAAYASPPRAFLTLRVVVHPLAQVHLVAPAHLLPITPQTGAHENQVIHHGVVVDALHERTDTHEVLGIRLLRLGRTIGDRLQVSVQTLHRAEVGERAPDELRVRRARKTHSLLVHARLLVDRRLGISIMNH